MSWNLCQTGARELNPPENPIGQGTLSPFTCSIIIDGSLICNLHTFNFSSSDLLVLFYSDPSTIRPHTFYINSTPEQRIHAVKVPVASVFRTASSKNCSKA